MSKIAILRASPTPADLRANASQVSEALDTAVQRLDATAAQVQSLGQLPDLVADQVTEALAPLNSLRQDVMKALEAFDTVSQVQRQTLSELAQELGTQATASMERRTEALEDVISTLTGQVRGLKSSTENAEASCKKLLALPSKLTSAATDAAKDMKTSSQILSKTALKLIPSAWRTLGLLLLASAMGALLVAAGQAGLNRLLPLSATQQSAAWAGLVWTNATPAERQLLTQLASRPAK